MERAVNVRPDVGVTACVRQQAELTVCRAVIERPTIISVRRGTKRLRSATQEHVIEAGSAIAIAGGQSFDITNRPAANGDYEAFWLVWDPSILLAYQGETPIQQAMLIQPMQAGFQEAYDRARAAIINPANVPQEIAIHRLKEVLVWLRMQGGCFEIPRPTSAAAQVRALLNSAPHQTWMAPEIAKQLAMSEATLRRKLQAENLSLTKIMLDLRLSHALVLLQSTDKSITQIANEIGYESPSRFAIRFRERFGQPPAAFRSNPR